MDELRRAAGRAADLMADHLGHIREEPVWRPVPAEDRLWLTAQRLPETGRALDELVEDVRSRVMRHPMGNGHPRFFGWVNSPPSPAGVLVEPLAAALNPSCAGGEHAGPLLERTVVRWLARAARAASTPAPCWSAPSCAGWPTSSATPTRRVVGC
jgi:aromatic-L-amino-acid/L-tryptophan decarboxylase